MEQLDEPLAAVGPLFAVAPASPGCSVSSSASPRIVAVAISSSRSNPGRSASSPNSRRETCARFAVQPALDGDQALAQVGVGTRVGPQVQRGLVERAGVPRPQQVEPLRRSAPGPRAGSPRRPAGVRPRRSARCSIAAATSAWRVWKWCRWAPRETPARSATRLVVVFAYPSSTRQAIVASSSACLVEALRAGLAAAGAGGSRGRSAIGVTPSYLRSRMNVSVVALPRADRDPRRPRDDDPGRSHRWQPQRRWCSTRSEPRAARASSTARCTAPSPSTSSSA